jgi:hypothetical protein
MQNNTTFVEFPVDTFPLGFSNIGTPINWTIAGKEGALGNTILRVLGLTSGIVQWGTEVGESLDFLCKVTMSANSSFGLLLRSVNAGGLSSGYFFGTLDGMDFVVQEVTDNVFGDELGSVTPLIFTDQPFFIRARVNGFNLYLRVWQADVTEPVVWSVTTASDEFAAGGLCLYALPNDVLLSGIEIDWLSMNNTGGSADTIETASVANILVDETQPEDSVKISALPQYIRDTREALNDLYDNMSPQLLTAATIRAASEVAAHAALTGVGVHGLGSAATADLGTSALNVPQAQDIPGLVPAASTTVQGKVELATSAETLAGTDTARAVTPKGHKDMDHTGFVATASETVAGIVELATNAEALTGTDTARAMTAAAVKHVMDNMTSPSHVHDTVDALDAGFMSPEMLTTLNSALQIIADNFVTLAMLEHGTQGDILYYGASGAPARLSAGVTGQVLKTNGAGSNPAWVDKTLPVSAGANSYAFICLDPIGVVGDSATPINGIAAAYQVFDSGVLTISFTLNSALYSAASARLYKNGQAVGTLRTTTGTFSENITVARGDIIQLYLTASVVDNATITNFKATAAEVPSAPALLTVAPYYSYLMSGGA